MATAEIAGWITEALAKTAEGQELRAVDERTGEITTLAVIHEWDRVQQEGETTGTERVLVARSAQLKLGCAASARERWPA